MDATTVDAKRATIEEMRIASVVARPDVAVASLPVDSCAVDSHSDAASVRADASVILAWESNCCEVEAAIVQPRRRSA